MHIFFFVVFYSCNCNENLNENINENINKNENENINKNENENSNENVNDSIEAGDKSSWNSAIEREIGDFPDSVSYTVTYNEEVILIPILQNNEKIVEIKNNLGGVSINENEKNFLYKSLSYGIDKVLVEVSDGFNKRTIEYLIATVFKTEINFWIFFAADNNLNITKENNYSTNTDMLYRDILELKKLSKKECDKVNIIAFIDLKNTNITNLHYKNDEYVKAIDKDGIYKFTAEKIIKLVAFESEPNTTNIKTFKTFLFWAKLLSPINEQCINIIDCWGHGAAEHGSMTDDSAKSGDVLLAPAINGAIKIFLTDKTKNLFMWSACSMMDVHTAYNLKESCEVMSGAANLMYGTGSYYYGIIKYLNDVETHQKDLKVIGKNIAEKNFQSYQEGGGQYISISGDVFFHTFSSVDLSKFDDFIEQWHEVIKKYYQISEEANLSDIKKDMLYYSPFEYDEKIYMMYVDVIDWTKKIQNHTNLDIQEEINNMKDSEFILFSGNTISKYNGKDNSGISASCYSKINYTFASTWNKIANNFSKVIE